MSIYKPQKSWLIEQLDSLNSQSYKNLELIVYNDCPEDEFNYDEFFEKHITNFNFRIINGNVNLGSTLAFEKLTTIADGDYFAYCDQDDIWLPEKIEILVNKIKEINKCNCQIYKYKHHSFIFSILHTNF